MIRTQTNAVLKDKRNGRSRRQQLYKNSENNKNTEFYFYLSCPFCIQVSCGSHAEACNCLHFVNLLFYLFLLFTLLLFSICLYRREMWVTHNHPHKTRDRMILDEKKCCCKWDTEVERGRYEEVCSSKKQEITWKMRRNQQVVEREDLKTNGFVHCLVDLLVFSLYYFLVIYPARSHFQMQLLLQLGLM